MKATMFRGSALALAISISCVPAAQADSVLDPTFKMLAGILNQPNFTPSDQYSINDDIWITADDGVTLSANLLVPTAGEGPFPAIIFINSWALNEYEYTIEAQKFAAQGYVVLSYSTRGFGASEGLIDTAGPKDMADLSKVIDWLIENAPVDPTRIGSAGISYGSGISLIGAAQDDRIRAVAAMSTWGSLVESLYGNATPSLIWGEVLNLSSQLMGRPDPIIDEYYNAMLHQELDRLPEIISWANARSPLTYVDQLNENGTAVYISKNWGDDMFHANSVLDLFSRLNGEKYIDLASGTHATTEVMGMMGLGSNRIFNNVHRWFDHHLKGVSNGIEAEKPVQMEVKLTGRVEGFSQFPVAEAHTRQWYLHPREFLAAGELEASPFQSWWSQTNRIDSLLDTVASTGIPILSQTAEQFNLPTLASMPLILSGQGIWFETNRLDDPLKIRGEANLKLQVEPQYKKAQLVAYLYDMDGWGMGKLITHAPVTLPAAEAGKAVTLDLNLVTTAYDVPAGHKLVLAVDTQDLLYAEPTLYPYAVEFKFTNKKQSVLTVPVL
ncbi:MAG: CocE/NonD family hydrolase [Hahellaceae bacterium]|nr:CocE/NonD family hydrolase [Hahellaceae bacterium]MCP5170081.1 CocE/NonD family hydrolase [Hahellaceae bacterium]